MNKFDAKIIEKIFKLWVEGMRKIDDRKIGPREFDCWLGGYIAGFAAHEKHISQKEVQKQINKLVKSKFVYSIGVTGTLIESLTLEEIK